MPPALPSGVYEQILTLALDAAATEQSSAGWTITKNLPDESLRPTLLARHIFDLAQKALDSIPGDATEKLSRQIDLTNQVLTLLRDSTRANVLLPTDEVTRPAELLLEARPPAGVPTAPQATPRPHLPLASSGLLVNGHHDYQIGAEVVREIESADRVDLLCAFVRFAGLRLVRPALKRLLDRGGELRVIASVYTGSTEKRALDELVALGPKARVKVSYETNQTRLHAKAWLFHRATGLDTAYIGSSNLTHTALVEGLEWNVRVSRVDNPAILERVSATFEQYWNEREFVDYVPAEDGDRLETALAQQRAGNDTTDADTMTAVLALGLEFEAKPHQNVILEQLEAERRRGHMKNLVVSATGTGKTWVSAFDYERLRKAGHDRLLFVAHREEILEQSRRIFQLVVKDPEFGERWVKGDRPSIGRHVFASIQSLARHVDAIDPAAFDVVIIDEFHHAAAPSYDALLQKLKPHVLLGLTATPERADGKSVLGWFDGRTAAEIRLWQALDQGLLCPFHYFGVADGTDLSAIQFRRGRYVSGELENVFTGDDMRVRQFVLPAIDKYVGDPSRMRALGFCVGVEHAKFMASRFVQAGLPAIALHADSPDDERKGAVGRLRRGEIRAIFTVDLFNEGVDIPEADTVLLLRPTESATVFLQQLGRGLRWAENKSVLTVLDFIGQAHRDYRFDVRYRALVGGTQKELERAIENGFPLLPPGCAVHFERTAQELVLQNLRQSISNARALMLDDLRALGPATRLGEFLQETERELEDVYARPTAKSSFIALRRDAGHDVARATTDEPHYAKAFNRLLHIDDTERLEKWRTWLTAAAPPPPANDGTRDQRLQWMLFAVLGHRRRPIAELPQALAELWSAPTLREELTDILTELADRTRTVDHPLDPTGSVPLRTHAHYSLLEIVAAYGLLGHKTGALLQTQVGALWVQEHQTELLFVTLEKSASDYSETTRYQDYPISPKLFHWESQNTVSPTSEKGRRYIEHAARGERIVLFVRERKDGSRGETLPYVCLGEVEYVSHEAERPMRIVWELEREMPAGLFQEGKLAAG